MLSRLESLRIYPLCATIGGCRKEQLRSNTNPPDIESMWFQKEHPLNLCIMSKDINKIP